MQALEPRPDLVAKIERITAATLKERLDGPEPPLLLDVRTERSGGEQRREGSSNIPLARLRGRLDEVPPGRRIVVDCASGYRSSIAASLRRRHGFAAIADLVGGMSAWQLSAA